MFPGKACPQKPWDLIRGWVPVFRPETSVTVIAKSGEKAYWNRIGVAWENQDDNGFNIKLFAMPLDGEIVLRVAKDKPDEEQS